MNVFLRVWVCRVSGEEATDDDGYNVISVRGWLLCEPPDIRPRAHTHMCGVCVCQCVCVLKVHMQISTDRISFLIFILY